MTAFNKYVKTWKQCLLGLAYFSGWNCRLSTEFTPQGDYIATNVLTSNSGTMYRSMRDEYVSGHKFIAIVSVYQYESGAIRMSNNVSMSKVITTEVNKWVLDGEIFEYSGGDNPQISYAKLNGNAGDIFIVRNPMVFDMTAMFGEGYEPTTVAEFLKLYNARYYPYYKNYSRE